MDRFDSYAVGLSSVGARRKLCLVRATAFRVGGRCGFHCSESPPEERGYRYARPLARCNIVALADEIHCGQYDFIDGFARHMCDALPNASFIGFTGTPIEKTDANTRAIAGDYISVYGIQHFRLSSLGSKHGPDSGNLLIVHLQLLNTAVRVRDIDTVH